MLDTEILAKSFKLKEMLVNSKEYKLVKEKEKIMLDKAYLVLDKYSKAMDEYNNAIRFKDYGGNIDKTREYLFKVKKEVDNNIYVKDYKKAYKEMTNILNNIQDIIFKDIFISNKIRIE